eukprot:TRINITY_DN1002_c1_g1_i1.p1 TRINITY_DN1002_c1_g1~~TRINITY_DN1002_c1_g1_i1.p1  ORF type:complete len:152 (+),score=2.58 TRINITY_DN1002_c1_g1_i1:577-1032(+)
MFVEFLLTRPQLQKKAFRKGGGSGGYLLPLSHLHTHLLPPPPTRFKLNPYLPSVLRIAGLVTFLISARERSSLLSDYSHCSFQFNSLTALFYLLFSCLIFCFFLFSPSSHLVFEAILRLDNYFAAALLKVAFFSPPKNSLFFHIELKSVLM